MAFFDGDRRHLESLIDGLRDTVDTLPHESDRKRLRKSLAFLEERFRSVLADIEQVWEEGRHERDQSGT